LTSATTKRYYGELCKRFAGHIYQIETQTEEWIREPLYILIKFRRVFTADWKPQHENLERDGELVARPGVAISSGSLLFTRECGEQEYMLFKPKPWLMIILPKVQEILANPKDTGRLEKGDDVYMANGTSSVALRQGQFSSPPTIQSISGAPLRLRGNDC
jgi:hypothetical protein